MALLILAVDPGAVGAAALVLAEAGEGRLLGAARWRDTDRDAAPLLLETWLASEGRIRRARAARWARLGLGVGRSLVDGRLDHRLVLAVESDFAGMVGGPAAVSGMVLGRRAEAVVSGIDLSVSTSPPVRELPSRSWRSLLGWPTTAGRSEGKAMALALAPAAVPGLSAALAALGDSEDLCEATGLALAVARVEARPEAAWPERLEAARRATGRSRATARKRP